MSVLTNRNAAGTAGAETQTTSYEFRESPAAVPHRRAPYRDPSGKDDVENKQPQPANIMYDKRVYRGNTYASQVLPPSAQAEAERLQREREERRARREQRRRQKSTRATRAPTPPPVEGRSHMEIQTENFLEELHDKPPEEEIGTQTDPLNDRPPSPMFVPAKAGVDKETQVEDGELFDFDMEVEPVLEVLVGRTLEQGLMEVLEEEELESIRKHQEEFEQIRNAELAEVQRMESEAKRKEEEKERRRKQEEERVERERQIKQKVAASEHARKYLKSVRQAVFEKMILEGHFADPVAQEVEQQFLPGVFEGSTSRLHSRSVSRSLVDRLVQDALAAQRKKQEEEYSQKEAEQEKNQGSRTIETTTQAREETNEARRRSC
eukprot:gb/GECG01006863.1/.p1 GENE.gb/GECG01006863.1/~~gb/GECG01006863.1/.p1  ORF type:complete len:379 (+),score=81.54 gb/GECG01006863.1/:1-1137(+)